MRNVPPVLSVSVDVGRSFKGWATGAPSDEAVICTVDTARAALDLVDNGMGIAFVPNECVESRPGIRFIPPAQLAPGSVYVHPL